LLPQVFLLPLAAVIDPAPGAALSPPPTDAQLVIASKVSVMGSQG
jgi:hypothetical protein